MVSKTTASSFSRRGVALLLGLAAVFGASSAHAEAWIWVGSVQLRGGFDSNPTLLTGSGEGSAFAGMDVAIAGGTSTDALTIGLVGEVSTTRYTDASVAPTHDRKLSLTIANSNQQAWAVKSSTNFENFRSYDERALTAAQSLRLQWMRGAFRPFLTGEVGFAALNETNAIFQDFLPEPHRTLRGTFIPGVAIRLGDLEFGTSLNLSAIRYASKLDDFLFRRDNERVEPFLFASYERGKLSAFASLSRLLGNWHDPDFADMRQTLYDLSLTWRGEPVEVELSARRGAKETTFPISPLAVEEVLSAGVKWAVAPNTVIGAYGSRKDTHYLGSPLRSRTVTFGGLVERRIGTDVVLAFEIGRSRAIPFAGEAANEVFAFASVKQSFGEGGGPKPASP